MRTEIIIYLYQCIVTYIVNDEEELQEGNTKKKEKEANGERERERERHVGLQLRLQSFYCCGASKP